MCDFMDKKISQQKEDGEKFRLCELDLGDLNDWIEARKELGDKEYGDEHLRRYNLVDVEEELIDALIILEKFYERVIDADEETNTFISRYHGVLNDLNGLIRGLRGLDVFLSDEFRREDVERVYFNSLGRGEEDKDGDVWPTYSVSGSHGSGWGFYVDGSSNYSSWPIEEDFEDRCNRIEGYGYVGDNFSVGDRVYAKKDIIYYKNFNDSLKEACMIDEGTRGEIIDVSGDSLYNVGFVADNGTIVEDVSADELTTTDPAESGDEGSGDGLGSVMDEIRDEKLLELKTVLKNEISKRYDELEKGKIMISEGRHNGWIAGVEYVIDIIREMEDSG